MRKNSRKSRPLGFTLPEIMIAMLIASVLFGFGYALLDMSSKVYHQVSGHNDGELQMKKLSRRLQKELVPSNIDSVRIEPVADTAGNASDAVSMLSLNSTARANGPVCTTVAGEPYWQRNVLFYLARPLGDTCTPQADVDGYEDACPHKVAIRKVIDSGVTTEPLPAGDPVNDMEEPLDSLAPFLTRPPGNYNVTGMLGEPGVTDVEVVAVNLLSMRVSLDPEPNSPGEVFIELRALNEEGARQTVVIGSTLLSGTGKTLTQILSCFPRNIH
jgi:prepilin-type N-terminal cleavage/methylation domain-containing protein